MRWDGSGFKKNVRVGCRLSNKKTPQNTTPLDKFWGLTLFSCLNVP